MNDSQASLLASLSESERIEVLKGLTERDAEELLWTWKFWARPEQLPPEGDWLTWLVMAGRGFGKTRTGAEWVRDRVNAGLARRIALVAETQRDLEDVMVFGDSGIASVFPPHQHPRITRKPVRIEFYNGAVALGYNATEPDQLRGPQFDTAWCDELAKWEYAQAAWDMLQFGLRLGDRPRQIVTTTPRPISVLKEIMLSPSTHVTRGSTYDNRANLAPAFFTKVVAKYGGTRLGRQELNAELLDDVPGALWTRDMFDQPGMRLPELADDETRLERFKRIVVAIDPSGTKGEDSADAVGIVVAAKGHDGRAYVLADRTCNLPPDGWGRRAVTAYHEFDADLIIAERNFGGAMVEHVIRAVDPRIAYQEVVASRGKAVRAEPVAALYEQGRVSHIGDLGPLEDQMCAMTPAGYEGDGSPDRLDAAVWALSELMLGEPPPRHVIKPLRM